jgi:trehalose monomycolate/heme transporter
MKRPLAFAIPILLGMIVLIIPLYNLSLGGMSEKYLPPNNAARQGQEEFDKLFPTFRTNPLTIVIQTTNHQPVTDQQIADVRGKAMAVSGFSDRDNNPANMWQERPQAPGASKDPSVRVLQNGLINQADAAKKLTELREITPPKGVEVWIGGTPALEQDSIHSLIDKAPLMLVVLISTTMVLMFLAFGSVVLPIKAAVMSVLTLGSTMGILTWIFIDGHFSKWLNFTPTPLMVVIIALVVAVGYGLATDYEVFLVSRMVEARARGMSTAEAIRIGTATTGRLITAAALVLAVVAGSFVFSDLVMMKYLAFGLMAALLLDATVVRMFLVPSVMKLLGDDCWWAPRWMRRLQNRLGLGDIDIPDERKRPTINGHPARPPVTAALAASTPRAAHDPTYPASGELPRPAGRSEIKPPQELPTGAPTMRTGMVREGGAPSSEGANTTRIQTRPSSPTEPATARLSTPGKAANTSAAPRERQADLRGPAAPQTQAGPTSQAPPPTPSTGQTRAMPVATNRAGDSANDPADPTAALPVTRPEGNDSDAATEKLNARGQGDNGDKARPRRHAGGGLSAQDLLRREGRL